LLYKLEGLGVNECNQAGVTDVLEGYALPLASLVGDIIENTNLELMVRKKVFWAVTLLFLEG